MKRVCEIYHNLFDALTLLLAEELTENVKGSKVDSNARFQL